MIYEKIEALCRLNGTTITALCREVTGSTGNLSTWKKDNFKLDAIANICTRFNVSADSLLDLVIQENADVNISKNGNEMLRYFEQLPERDQLILIGRVQEMAQQHNLNKTAEIEHTG